LSAALFTASTALPKPSIIFSLFNNGITPPPCHLV
jgi:hypothetical protein